MADEHVVDVTGDGKWSVDQVARDRLEEVVLGVKPPGPSLVAADSEVSFVMCKLFMEWLIDWMW